MNDAVDRNQIRAAAGDIIAALQGVYGKPMDTFDYRRMERILVHDNMDPEKRSAMRQCFQTAFRYCLDQGYIEVLVNPADAHDRNPRRDCKLSSKGLQLWLGNLQDKAVDLSAYLT